MLTSFAGLTATAALLLWGAAEGTALAERSTDEVAAVRALADVRGADAGPSEAGQRAERALERARRFRESGDEPRARLAEAAGKAWAEAARENLRTSAKERDAEEKLALLADAGAGATRERALLEETQLANERLRAQIDQAKRDRNAADAGSPTRPPPSTTKPRADAPKRAKGDAR